MRRTKAEAQQTRQDILNAALVLFDEVGYNKTSLNGIAKRANLTRGAIYWHFPNKEEILNGIAEQQFADMLQKNDEALTNGNLWQRLVDSFSEFFSELNSNPRRELFFRIIHKQHGSDEVVAKLNARYEEQWQNHCLLAIKQGVLNGELSNDIDQNYLRYYLMVMTSGLMKIFFEKPEQRNEFNRYASQLITDSISLFLANR